MLMVALGYVRRDFSTACISNIVLSLKNASVIILLGLCCEHISLSIKSNWDIRLNGTV